MIREYRESDLERLKELHRKQGFAYPFPELNDPVFAVGAVAEQNGEAQMAAFLKIHGEAYLFLDPSQGPPEERWKTLLEIHAAVRRQAEELGLDSVTCWIPPNLEKSFAKRLRKLGWAKDEWAAYSYRIRSIAKS